MKEVFKLHAEVCKTLAHPKRLEIIYVLKGGERPFGEIVKTLGLPKANVSQHLAIMRISGVVKARREGVNIYYSISSPKIVKACALMREVMEDMLEDRVRKIKKGRFLKEGPDVVRAAVKKWRRFP